MKNNKLVLAVLCIVGAYGCYWSYKHGPYDLSNIKLPDINIKQPDQKPADVNDPIPPQFVPPLPKK